MGDFCKAQNKTQTYCHALPSGLLPRVGAGIEGGRGLNFDHSRSDRIYFSLWKKTPVGYRKHGGGIYASDFVSPSCIRNRFSILIRSETIHYLRHSILQADCTPS